METPKMAVPLRFGAVLQSCVWNRQSIILLTLAGKIQPSRMERALVIGPPRYIPCSCTTSYQQHPRISPTPPS